MDSIDLLIEMFDDWDNERKEQILQIIKKRWYETQGNDFTDEELDEQFEGLEDD